MLDPTAGHIIGGNFSNARASSDIIPPDPSNHTEDEYFYDDVPSEIQATLGLLSIPVVSVQSAVEDGDYSRLIDFKDVYALDFCDYVKHHVVATADTPELVLIIRVHYEMCDDRPCIIVTVRGTTYRWEPRSFDYLYRYARGPVRFDQCSN